jgi:Putative metal-binding motif
MLSRVLLAAACALPLAAAPAYAAPPANNLVAGATPLTLGVPVSQTTLEATSVGEPGTAAPAPSGCARMGRTVWFRLRGTGHTLTVSTAGSQINTVVAIYDTANTPTDGNRVDCDDDALAPQSRASVDDTVRGNTYLVQVGEHVQDGCTIPPDNCASAGAITVRADGSPRPANDNRSAPQALGTGTPVTVDNRGATTEPGERTSCGTTPYAGTIWFAWTAPAPGTPSFSASAAFPTVATVYRASDGAVLACGGAPLGPVQAGEKLLVQVGARGTDTHGLPEGAITLQATLTPPLVKVIDPPPPPDLDGDDDGFAPPQDCDDANATVNPLATEVRGNTVDENCDRATLGLLRITSGIRNRWAVFPRHTRVLRLTVRDAPVGAIARVKCRGDGCPRKAKRLKSTGGKELRFAPFLAGRKLKPGAVVEVRITLADRIGKVARYRIRNRKTPLTKVRCLQPGAKRPTACPRAAVTT